MDGGQNIQEAFKRACDRERELWLLVRGQVPGDPDCPIELWREWLRSAQLVRVLAAEHARMVVRPRIE